MLADQSASYAGKNEGAISCAYVIPFAQYGHYHHSAEIGDAAAVPSLVGGKDTEVGEKDTEAGTAVPNPAGTETAAVAKVEVGIVVASKVALAVEEMFPNPVLVGIEAAGSNWAAGRMVAAGPADSIPVAASSALAVAPNQIEPVTVDPNLTVVE